jgi:hypothetical protein
LYTNVPPGSRVFTRLGPVSGKFSATAKLIGADDVVHWNPLTDTSGKGPLEAGMHYVVSVRLVFNATETAELEISVVKDGVVHSQPWKWTIPGNAGDVRVRGGLIRVVKAAAGGGA